MTIAFNLKPEPYIQSTFSRRAIFAYCLLLDFWMLHVHVLTFVYLLIQRLVKINYYANNLEIKSVRIKWL
jgi:hypothetical protein